MSIDYEWMKEVQCIYTMEYYLLLKKEEILVKGEKKKKKDK